MAALVLLTIAGSAGAYPGVEHPLLALRSFSAWQDFDPSFYHALTDATTPGTQAALDRYMCVKFYLIGAMIPDLFEPGSPGLSRGVIEKLYLAKDFVTGPIKISNSTKSQVAEADSFVWHDGLRPNNDLPALHRMALMARGSFWTNREKAMIYGAYLHVVQDLHSACFQNPSLWGTCFVAEPASVVNDFAPLDDVEFAHNMFELTSGLTAADWDSVTYYLFGQSAGSSPNIEIGHMQLTFYRHVVNWGPIPPREVEEWQDLDFPEVARFVQAANTYFSVDNLTPERLEAYLQGFAIPWFMLAGYTDQNYQTDAGGVFAHTSWDFGDITEYVYNIAYDQFQWWVYPIIWLLEGWVRSYIAFCLHMTPDLGFAVAELTGLNEPWPSYFETPTAIDEWKAQLIAKYGGIPQELEDYVNTTLDYVYRWTDSHRGANPCFRATYSGEFNTAVDLIPEERRVLTGGPAKLSHVMDTPVAGTQVYQLALKAGLVGGMYEGDIGDRQPGIARIGLVRRGLSLHSALEVPTGGGDPNTAKLFYDLLPFGPFVRVSLMAKTAWQGQWQVIAQSDVTDRQYSRVIDSLQVSLQTLAQQGYRYLGYCVTNSPAGQVAVNSDYKAAYDAPVFQGQTPYREWLRDGETRRAPDQNPFTNPKENWPCVSEIVPVGGWYLEMPTGLTARIGNSGHLAVDLSWIDNSSYELEYHIEKTVNHASPTYTGPLAPNTQYYEDIDVAFGDTYRYRVWCEREQYSSDTTPYVERVVTVMADLPPTAHNNQNKVVVNGSDVHVTYSTGSNGVTYVHSSDGGKTWDAPECAVVMEAGPGSPAMALNSAGEPCILYPGVWSQSPGPEWRLPYWVTWRRAEYGWDNNMAFVISSDPNLSAPPPMDLPVASFCMRGDTWFAALDYPGYDSLIPENPGTYYATHQLVQHSTLGWDCGVLDSIAPKSNYCLPTVLIDASGRRLVVSTYGDDVDTVIRVSYMDAGQSTFSYQEYKWENCVYNITGALEADSDLLLAWVSSGFELDFARFVKGTPGYTMDPAEIVPDLADWQHTKPKFLAGLSNLPMLVYEHDPTYSADVWYASRVAPGSWVTDAILTSDYFLGHPQGFRVGSRLGVFASGSENLDDPPYYLVSGSVSLPWYQFPPTSNAYATWPSSGRKLVLHPDNEGVHVVYSTGDSVLYAVSQDDGETWGDATPIDCGDYPSVALDAAGLPTIVYQRNDTIFSRMMRADSSWKDMTLYLGSSALPPGTPAVDRLQAAIPSSYPYCAFPCYNQSTGRTKIGLVKLDTLGVTTTWVAESTVIPPMDSFVSVACSPDGPICVAWQRANRVMCATFTSGGMPSYVQVADSAIHPFIYVYGDHFYLVWRHVPSGWIVTSTRPVDGGSWGTASIASPSGDYPVCSKAGTAAWQEWDLCSVNDVWAKVCTLEYNLSESEHISSEYPHMDVSVGGTDSTPVVNAIYGIWTENVGDGFYSVRFRKLGVSEMAPDGVMAKATPLVLEPRLYDAAPCPSRGRTVLRYQIPRPTHVTLKMYDASGRIVRTVLDSKRPAGVYSLAWDGRDQRGRVSPNGIYFCTMKAGDYHSGKKLVISR